MHPLSDIPKLEQIVFFDSSADNLGKFRENIGGVRRYADLNRDLLVMAQTALQEFLAFIQHENTFTVEQTLADFQNLYGVMSKRQVFFDMNVAGTGRAYATQGEHKRELFIEISGLVLNIRDILNPKILEPEDGRFYDNLYQAVCRAVDQCGVMRFSPRQLHMYALALYTYMKRSATVAVVSRSRKTHYGLMLLGNQIRMFVPHRDITHFPARLYFGYDSGAYNLIYPPQNEKPIKGINT